MVIKLYLIVIRKWLTEIGPIFAMAFIRATSSPDGISTKPVTLKTEFFGSYLHGLFS